MFYLFIVTREPNTQTSEKEGVTGVKYSNLPRVFGTFTILYVPPDGTWGREHNRPPPW